VREIARGAERERRLGTAQRIVLRHGAGEYQPRLTGFTVDVRWTTREFAWKDAVESGWKLRGRRVDGAWTGAVEGGMRRVALALLLSLAGCAGIQQLAASAVQKPKLTFRTASVTALDLEGATVSLTWDLENPNGFGVDLAKVSWTFDAEGRRVAAGELPGGLQIRANGTSPVTFPVRIRYQDVPGIVNLLGSGKDEIRYAVGATVGVRTPVGVLDVPVTHADKLRLPSMPHFAIDGLSIRSIGFDAIVLDVRLRVRNANPFALPTGKLEYALSLSGADVARAETVAVEPVAGGSSAVVLIPVRIDVGSAGRVATDIARGADVQVALKGSANLAGIPFPLNLNGHLPARR
jgi:LEA14-like dessication related protein